MCVLKKKKKSGTFQCHWEHPDVLHHSVVEQQVCQQEGSTTGSKTAKNITSITPATTTQHLHWKMPEKSQQHHEISKPPFTLTICFTSTLRRPASRTVTTPKLSTPAKPPWWLLQQLTLLLSLVFLYEQFIAPFLCTSTLVEYWLLKLFLFLIVFFFSIDAV